jgi:hypothetical protein
MINEIIKTFFVIIFISQCVYAQENSNLQYENLDTIKFYDIAIVGPGFVMSSSSDSCSMFIDSTQIRRPGTYFLNCIETSKDSFDYYVEKNSQLYTCKPCVVQHYNLEEQLISTIVQYTDCYVGDVITYYRSGSIKYTGHFKENHTEKWRKFLRKEYTGLQDGIWLFYDEAGNLIETINYDILEQQ